MSTSITRPRTETKSKTERPRAYKVILLNDDYTPREFVVTVLRAVFRMSTDRAHGVMLTAHMKGCCVVAVFARDIAETKATQAVDMGARQGYPLMFTTEPEE
jgi:ATP-dependent Clp protease adaptor protein ClpS